MDQQEFDLVMWTIDNLDFIQRHKQTGAVWEITQTVNSYLGVVAHPRERLFDAEKIKWLKLDDPMIQEAGLPRMCSSWDYDREEPRTLGHLLRLLRNGIAHGNVDLLDRAELLTYRPDAEVPHQFPSVEIAAAEIWNEDKIGRSWGTILTVDEMESALRAFAKLAESPMLRRDRFAPKRGGRRDPPRLVPGRRRGEHLNG